jgi:hypothetical protein
MTTKRKNLIDRVASLPEDPFDEVEESLDEIEQVTRATGAKPPGAIVRGRDWISFSSACGSATRSHRSHPRRFAKRRRRLPRTSGSCAKNDMPKA